jgi:hypothetical protein
VDPVSAGFSAQAEKEPSADGIHCVFLSTSLHNYRDGILDTSLNWNLCWQGEEDLSEMV